MNLILFSKDSYYHIFTTVQFSSVQFSCSVRSNSLQPHESQHARPPCPSPTHGVYLNLCPSSLWSIRPSHPLSSPSPPAPPIPPSIRVFSNASTLRMRCPKYWNFSFSISPSNEHPGLNSFRMDWLDLLSGRGTLKRLLQHHSSKASSSALSFLHSPTLISIHDYWRSHSLD